MSGCASLHLRYRAYKCRAAKLRAHLGMRSPTQRSPACRRFCPGGAGLLACSEPKAAPSEPQRCHRAALSSHAGSGASFAGCSHPFSRSFVCFVIGNAERLTCEAEASSYLVEQCRSSVELGSERQHTASAVIATQRSGWVLRPPLLQHDPLPRHELISSPV